jgi:hypothetical protein
MNSHSAKQQQRERRKPPQRNQLNSGDHLKELVHGTPS